MTAKIENISNEKLRDARRIGKCEFVLRYGGKSGYLGKSGFSGAEIDQKCASIIWKTIRQFTEEGAMKPAETEMNGLEGLNFKIKYKNNKIYLGLGGTSLKKKINDDYLAELSKEEANLLWPMLKLWSETGCLSAEEVERAEQYEKNEKERRNRILKKIFATLNLDLKKYWINGIDEKSVEIGFYIGKGLSLEEAMAMPVELNHDSGVEEVAAESSVSAILTEKQLTELICDFIETGYEKESPEIWVKKKLAGEIK